MLNFNKLFTYKIISIIVIITFTVTSICYGIDLPKKSHLRAPLLSSTQEGKQRFQYALENHELKAETIQKITKRVVTVSNLALVVLVAISGFGVNLPFVIFGVLSGPVVIIFLIAVILQFKTMTLPYSKVDNDKLINDAWDIVKELKTESVNDPKFQSALLLIKRFVVSPMLPQFGSSYNYIVKDTPMSDEELVKEYVHHLPTGTLVISASLMRNKTLAKYVIAHRAAHFMYERLGSNLRNTKESFAYNNVESRIKTFIIARANSTSLALNYELMNTAISYGIKGVLLALAEALFIYGIWIPLLRVIVAIRDVLFGQLDLSMLPFVISTDLVSLSVVIIFFFLFTRYVKVATETERPIAKTNEQVVDGIQELLKQGPFNWDKIRHQYYLHPDDLEILITLLKDRGLDVEYENESGNLVLIRHQNEQPGVTIGATTESQPVALLSTNVEQGRSIRDTL